MRSFIVSSLIGVALICGASLAGAAQVPDGSYRQTCRNIQVTGNNSGNALLIADCRTRKGYWLESNLRYKQCAGDIYNDDGALRCKGGRPGNPGGLPSGSWRDSCRNAYADGRNLYAECQTTRGRWQDATLNLSACPYGPVTNDNGRLICGGGHGGYSSLVLYQDPNFRGRTLQLTRATPDLRVFNFDRRASSLRVQGSWYVCSGINYSGECSKVAGSFNLSSKWNDHIFSARPY